MATGVLDATATTTFLLVRHGETYENVAKLMQGQQETQLNETGQTQALQIAEAISRSYPQLDVIYSSPLQRAMLTAAATADKLGKTVLIDDRFKEINWGVAQGVPIATTKEMLTQEYKEATDAQLSRQELWNLPLFEKAESYHTVLKRVQEGLKSLAEEHPSQTVVIFTHSRVMRVLVDDLLNQDDAQTILNGSVAEFTYTPAHVAEPLQFKKVVHLIKANH